MNRLIPYGLMFTIVLGTVVAAEDPFAQEIRDLNMGVFLSKKNLSWVGTFKSSKSEQARAEFDYCTARAKLAAAKLRYLTGEVTTITKDPGEIKQQADVIEEKLAQLIREGRERRQKEFAEMLQRQSLNQRLDDISRQIEELQLIRR